MKKRIIFGVLITSAVLLGGGMAYMVLAQTSSTQVTACARPNGEIYLIGPDFSRQNCSGQQVEISWPTLAGTPKILAVQDQNGVNLGHLLDVDQQGQSIYEVFDVVSELILTYEQNNSTFFVELFLPSFPAYPVYFSGTDCTGSIYALPNAYISKETVRYVSTQGEIYVRGTDTQSQAANVGSYVDDSSSPCINQNMQIEGLIMERFDVTTVNRNPPGPLRIVGVQF